MVTGSRLRITTSGTGYPRSVYPGGGAAGHRDQGTIAGGESPSGPMASAGASLSGRAASHYNTVQATKRSTHKPSSLVHGDKRLYTAVARFEWDPRQAEANLRTHGVSFAQN